MISHRISKTARAYDSIRWDEELEGQLKSVSDARVAKSMISRVVGNEDAGNTQLVVDKARALSATKVLNLAGRFRLRRDTLEEVVRSVVDVEYERNYTENNPVWRRMVESPLGEDKFRLGLSLSLLSNEKLVASLATAAEKDGVDPAELYRLSKTRVLYGGNEPTERERMRAAADVFDYFDSLRVVEGSVPMNDQSDVMGWRKEDMVIIKKELARGDIWPAVFALEEGMRWSGGRGDFQQMHALNLMRKRLVYGEETPDFPLSAVRDAFESEVSSAQDALSRNFTAVRFGDPVDTRKQEISGMMKERVDELARITESMGGGDLKPALDYMNSTGAGAMTGGMLHEIGRSLLDSFKPESMDDLASMPKNAEKYRSAYEMWARAYDALTGGDRRYRP